MCFFFFSGVLMWEVFTCGEVPYGRLSNTEVVNRVQKGQILEKPKGCLDEIYNVSFFLYSLYLRYERMSQCVTRKTLDLFVFAVLIWVLFNIPLIIINKCNLKSSLLVPFFEYNVVSFRIRCFFFWCLRRQVEAPNDNASCK